MGRHALAARESGCVTVYINIGDIMDTRKMIAATAFFFWNK